MKKFADRLLLFILLWLVAFPLLLLVIESVRTDGAFNLEAFSLLVHDSTEWAALGRSLKVSLLSVLAAGTVGIPLAFLFAGFEFPGRRVLSALVVLPVALPPLVGVIAFLFLWGETGFVARALSWLFQLEEAPWRLDGLWAIVLVHAYSMYVYFFLFTRSALEAFDHALLEASASLGIGRFRTFQRVVWPLILPAILGASLLTFLSSLASFSAPYIFGGGYRVMTTQIVSSKLNGDLDMAEAESILLAITAVLALWILSRFEKSVTVVSSHGVGGRRQPIRSRILRWTLVAAAWIFSGLLLLPHLTLILLSFVPLGTWTVEALPPILDLSNYRGLAAAPERLRPIINSAWMATVATAIALVLGFLTVRRAQSMGRKGKFMKALAMAPWAVPGTVFAIALAATYSQHQPYFGRFLLIGTPWLLPMAYLLRSLPLTSRAAVAGLAQFDTALEEAGASLGVGPFGRFRKILLPLLGPALLAGAGLAFITSLGDFVTSIVLYSYTNRPIAIEILSSLRLQDLGMASVYGVLLTALSALAFFFGERQARSS